MTADPDLQALLDGVVSSIDDDLAADPGCPDLAAVVARAHELDPQRIPAHLVAEVNQWAPVVSIQQGHRRRRTRDDLELVSVIAGVRADVEQDVATRLGTPPMTTAAVPPAPAPAQVGGRRVWGLTLAAAAALVIVGFGVLQAGRWGLLEDDPSRSEAALVGPAPVSAASHEVVPGSPDPEPKAEMPAVPEVEVSVVESEEPASEEGAVRSKAKRSRRGKPTPRALLPTLEELDAMAHAAWRAGDLPEAERLFRTLAKRAGKDRLGDLAYGDLFTLARQRKEPSREVALWREYLRKFPQGRFADDASAGLCRRASGDAQSECWQAYLDKRPEGAHRAQAARALAKAEDATP